MLNRSLLVVRLKQPFVDWINEADPNVGKSRITLEEANTDSTTFLIHEDACEDLDDWLQQLYQLLFESILEEWYVDPALWPQDRGLDLFNAWCEVEVHGIVIDLLDEPLLDNDFE